MRRILLAIAATIALSACAQSPANSCGGGFGFNKQTGGAVLGGVGGAVAGAQFGKGNGNLAMTAIGTLLGAAAGNEVGSSLDRADCMYMQQQQQREYGVRAYQQQDNGAQRDEFYDNPNNYYDQHDMVPHRSYGARRR